MVKTISLFAVHNVHISIVEYGKVTENASVSLISIQREVLFSKLNIEVSDRISFQPEEHGYFVIFIAEGMTEILP